MGRKKEYLQLFTGLTMEDKDILFRMLIRWTEFKFTFHNMGDRIINIEKHKEKNIIKISLKTRNGRFYTKYIPFPIFMVWFDKAWLNLKSNFLINLETGPNISDNISPIINNFLKEYINFTESDTHPDTNFEFALLPEEKTFSFLLDFLGNTWVYVNKETIRIIVLLRMACKNKYIKRRSEAFITSIQYSQFRGWTDQEWQQIDPDLI